MALDFFLIYSVWLKASIGLLGVLGSQGSSSPSDVLGGDGVCNLASNWEITYSGSNGTSPAPRNPPNIFDLAIVVVCVV